MAKENPGWGYDRIVGALANLGHIVSDQTVGNVPRRHGLAPAPKRSQNTTWKDFITSHMAVLAGVDFFTVEVLTWRGLATYYVLFFLHLETRRVKFSRYHPTSHGELDGADGTQRDRRSVWPSTPLRYVLHDWGRQFCASFRAMLATGNVKCLALPPRSPNLSAFVERWVRSVKQECLSRLVLFGEGSLQRALTEFLEHYHAERNHQGKGNVLLFPSKDASQAGPGSSVRRRQRLGGLLNYYCRTA